MNIQRYNSYKNSGIEWMGQIPEHWRILKANYLFKLINERSLNGEEELLSVSEHHGVKPRSMSNVNTFMAESYEGYKLCKKGDLVINSLWAWSRGLGISNYDGIISTAYSVYRPDFDNYNKEYLNYLLRIDKYVAQYLIYSKGIWISRLILSDWAFLRIPVLTPPLQEQQRIANFLDRKTSQIDEAIAQKEKMIELLKEYRQVTINNAVINGLNPNVPIKDSGIEWIGQIPEHWDVKAIKRICKINPSSKANSLSKDTLVEFLPMENIDESIGVIKKYNYLTLRNVEHGYTSFRNGDVLFAKITPCMENGNCVIVEGLAYNICYGSTEFIVFRQNNKILNKMLFYYFRNTNFRTVFENNMRGSAGQKRISSDFIGNFSIALAPVEEQQQIADFLDIKTSQINESISLKQSEITKLKEYKATLIDSAVTGKIKV